MLLLVIHEDRVGVTGQGGMYMRTRSNEVAGFSTRYHIVLPLMFVYERELQEIR
jgi:hypothetical protein